MPGPLPKPKDERKRRNKPNQALVVDIASKKVSNPSIELPDPPKGLLKSTRDLWGKYWASKLSRATDVNTDIGAINRLFTLYDERERAYRGYKKERLVKGSQGQLVLNPLARLMKELDAEIRQLEDRLGMTPRSRLQLGITYTEAAKSLEDLNRSLEIDDEDPRG